MKIAIVTCSISATILGLCLFASPPPSPSTDALHLRNLERYVKITERPFEMHDSTALLCKAPVAPDEVPSNPHEPTYPKAAFCNVYVNAVAKDVILSGTGQYPVGSVVIKSKLSSVDDTTPDLFTVMQKMPSGYDRERGDWKYIVVDGATYRQLAAGRIDSCIDCHEHYKATDFVTREYLTKN